ncbi:MAG: DUF2997 domain-containing protein [Synechococcaceae cyanobacterium RL_1_2]|nr:DUF2997 domain-containing protein [Synechococcaceae cyanobacterium RL_1_2]
MTMETLEFIIYPDGRVKEKVTGIEGSSCEEITAAIEEQLGNVVSHTKTSDYFARSNQTLSNAQKNLSWS